MEVGHFDEPVVADVLPAEVLAEAGRRQDGVGERHVEHVLDRRRLRVVEGDGRLSHQPRDVGVLDGAEAQEHVGAELAHRRVHLQVEPRDVQRLFRQGVAVAAQRHEVEAVVPQQAEGDLLLAGGDQHLVAVRPHVADEVLEVVHLARVINVYHDAHGDHFPWAMAASGGCGSTCSISDLVG